MFLLVVCNRRFQKCAQTSGLFQSTSNSPCHDHLIIEYILVYHFTKRLKVMQCWPWGLQKALLFSQIYIGSGLILYSIFPAMFQHCFILTQQRLQCPKITAAHWKRSRFYRSIPNWTKKKGGEDDRPGIRSCERRSENKNCWMSDWVGRGFE